MDVLEQFDLAAAEAQRVLDALDDSQWATPSPCTEWDVRAVLNHLVSGNLMFAAIVLGTPSPDRQADHLGERPADAFARSVVALRTAFTGPGVLDNTYPTPIGEQPGTFLVHMRVNEMVVHAWDVAAATGQSTDIAPGLADSALGMWHARLADHGRPEGGPFGPEQPAPPGATAADRLAAFLGREVITR